MTDQQSETGIEAAYRFVTTTKRFDANCAAWAVAWLCVCLSKLQQIQAFADALKPQYDLDGAKQALDGIDCILNDQDPAISPSAIVQERMP